MSGYCHHRDLPSFPTRRSSDLQINRLPPLQDQNVQISAADLGQVTWSDLSLAVDAHLIWTTPIRLLTYIGAGTALHALDRKSTRLNSSHSQISYAVFCLKKKTS